MSATLQENSVTVEENSVASSTHDTVVKPKRIMTEAQRENLAKARAKAAQLRNELKKEQPPKVKKTKLEQRLDDVKKQATVEHEPVFSEPKVPDNKETPKVPNNKETPKVPEMESEAKPQTPKVPEMESEAKDINEVLPPPVKKGFKRCERTGFFML